MADNPLNILLIDNNLEDVEIIRNMIKKYANFSAELISVDHLSKGLEYLNIKKFDIILSDLGLPDSQGIDTLKKIMDKVQDVPIIVLTGLEDETLGIQSVQQGAQDYLIKSKVEGKMLGRSLSYAIERKIKDAKLRESEERVHKIINENADGIIIVDKKGVICFVNPAAEKLFGRKKDELIGNLFGYPIGSNIATELNILHKSLKSVVVDMRVVEIDWEGESVYLATLRDITARKNVENRLRDAKSFTESIISNVPSILYSVDRLSQISFISPKCEKLYGYTADEFKDDPTKLWVETVHPVDRQKLDTIFEKIRNGESYSIEYRIIDKEGNIHWVLDSGNPLLDSDGKVNRLEGNISDITEHKLVEQALKESEERFRMVTEESIVGVYIIQNDKFVYTNPKLAQIFGYMCDEIVDKLTLIDLTYSEDRSLVGKNIRKRIKKNMKSMQYIFRGQRKDGSIIYCESLGRFIRYKNHPAIIGTLMDITERKKMEEELEKYTNNLEEEVKQKTNELIQSEKMASLGQLVAGVAHEINNPLAFITLNSQKIEDQIMSLKNSYQDGTIQSILQNILDLEQTNIKGINRISEITKSLKRFAMPNKKGKALANINQGIKDTLQILFNQFKQRISVHEKYGDLPQIKCNIGQLNQVFMNLLLNSSQAMEHGDVWIQTWCFNKNIFIEIKDNGNGMDDKIINDIFNPFFTTKENGLGLGLSLSYRIIKDHNGDMKVQSKVGEGTKMLISLPMDA